jgi:hypothetical protein
LQSYPVIRRFLPAILLTLLGLGLATFLAPREVVEVRDHLTGFPDSDATAHLLRPTVLAALCLIPALAALYYGIVGAIDRYLIRQFMGAFLLCFSSLYSIWLISDLTNNIENFRESGNTIQTGRGVVRLISPLIVMGLIVSLVCLGFNYRWAPSASGYQEALLEQAEMGSLSKARNVVYSAGEERRLWLVGSFPYEYHRGEPLKNIIIRSFTPEGKPEGRLEAKLAEWDRETNNWTFTGVSRWDMTHRLITPDGSKGPISPKLEKNIQDPLVMTQWPETPWKLIKPGLRAEQLGIPGLYSWPLFFWQPPWESFSAGEEQQEELLSRSSCAQELCSLRPSFSPWESRAIFHLFGQLGEPTSLQPPLLYC